MENNSLQTTQKGLQKIIGFFQQNKYVQAISGGMMSLLPVMLVGSFAAVFSNLGIDAYQAFLKATGIKIALGTVSNMTMNVLSIYVVAALSYRLAKSYKVDCFMAVSLSLMAFFILTPISAVEKAKMINMNYIGSRGMIIAMITALTATRLYVWIVGKNITITMPDGVPEFVSSSFASLVPGFGIAIVYVSVGSLVAKLGFGNIHDMVYKLLQIPLQGLGTSVVAALVIVFLSECLWFFGIHGTAVTSTILFALFYQFDVSNLQAFQSGSPLPYIVTMTFINAQKGPRYLALSFLLLRCKSVQMKGMGKIGFLPGCFGISEPYKFGLPMVLNPLMLIPLGFAGPINVGLTYLATVSGLIPRVNGMALPLAGTPEIFKGFMIGGWRMAIWHIVLLFVTMAVYYPFVRMMDKQRCAEEAQAAGAAKNENH
jgi:PTS system cellobiose-specific IIC component